MDSKLLNMDIYELKSIIFQDFDFFCQKININQLKIELSDYEKLANSQDLWLDANNATLILKKYNHLKESLKEYDDLKSQLNDVNELIAIVLQDNDKNLLESLKENLWNLYHKIREKKTNLLFNQENDDLNCYMEIHAGSGGLDAQDFALMLLRMYSKFANMKAFKYKIVDENSQDGIGIKSAILKIEGLYSFGWLKNESGVHRLIRLSPFNADSKRHTSFVSIDVYPEIKDNKLIEINPIDLKIDTFRSSGAGGQHVNTTDSAIRITHLPTNIVVQCQAERSQHQNKDSALKMLKLKLYQLQLAKLNEKKDKNYQQKNSIDFGHQIRSYTLQPYSLIKDHRIAWESGDVKSFLDGNIGDLILTLLAKL
jgi:peptide chain release factor 2